MRGKQSLYDKRLPIEGFFQQTIFTELYHGDGSAKRKTMVFPVFPEYSVKIRSKNSLRFG